MKTPCFVDEGLESRVPETHLPITFFVDAYHRLGGDLEVLQHGFHLEAWQLHAAMAFYCANKELFDAEYERTVERHRQYWENNVNNEEGRKAWAEFVGALRGDETDEEVNAALERLS